MARALVSISVVLTCVLLACEGDGPTADCTAAVDCAGKVTLAECQVAACTDGSCVPTSAADGTPCTDGTCQTGQCVITSACQTTECDIGGSCIPDSRANPANTCQYCDVTFSTTQWREKVDGDSCDDGDPQTTNDKCTAGACAGCRCTETTACCDGCDPINEGNGCPDDGLACTSDTCTLGSCSHVTTTGCLIGGECFDANQGHPTNECRRCDAATPTAWSDTPDGTSCDGGDGRCDGGACVPDCDCDVMEADCCADGCHAAANATPCQAGAGACNAVGACVLAECECSSASECCSDGCHWDANGTVCDDDGLTCTDDTCASRACVHTPQAGWCAIAGGCYAHDTPDPANGCRVCDAAGAATVWSNKADTTPCSDGNSCTTGDTCEGGTCTPGPTTPCNSPPNDCHEVGTCNPSTGGCDYPFSANTKACDDGDGDTGPDKCNGGGLCLGGDCTCAPSGPCCDCHPINAGGPCVDDGVSCTDDICDGGLCTHPITAGCLIDSQCVPAGTEDPGNDCRECAPGASDTAWSPKEVETPCDDGNKCTQVDRCESGGVCVGINPVTCPPPDQCHNAGTCNTSTGVCSNPEKPGGTHCNDEDPCTTGDDCDDHGVCGGDAVVCDQGDPQCEDAGVCVDGGCVYADVGDGTDCDDGDASNGTNDTCQDGACVGAGCACDPATEPECCGTDTSSGSYCQPVNESGSCTDTDGLPCTEAMCGSGQCTQDHIKTGWCRIEGICRVEGATQPGNSCRACTAAAPTIWVKRTDGTPCSDGDACTLNDTCQTGNCDPGPLKSWPDPDAFEPNPNPYTIYTGTPIPPFDGSNSVDTLVIPPDTNIHFFNPSDPVDAREDNDFFGWTYGHPGATLPVVFWTCRVTGLEPDQTVIIWAGAHVGAFSGTYNLYDVYSEPVGNGAVFAPWLSLSQGSWYVLAAGVLPISGFDTCGNDYTLSCRLDLLPDW